MISLDSVSKFILKDVSIHIPRGEAVGLIGASGAGKTTLLKLVCGLLMPEAGNVYTFGKDPLQNGRTLGKQIGVLFADKPIFREEESVWDNFRSLQIIHGLSDEGFHREYEELSKRLGFGEWERVQVKKLSLGQRRRAELAAVLLHRPELLLLDEPMNGLDANAKTVFREMVEERTKQGMTLLVSSHNMTDITQLCKRMAVLHRGRLLYYGSEQQLLRKYAPTDIMHLRIQGKLPDMADLPLQRYEINNDELILIYDSNHISSAEILSAFRTEAVIREVSVRKSDLADVILRIEKGENDEQFY